MITDSSPEIDVCFVLEGTYPYISGGVSTWVHQAISAMPDLTFAIHFIGAQSNTLGDSKYEVPENVVSLEKVFIFGDENKADNDQSSFSSQDESNLNEAFETLFQLLDSRADHNTEIFAQTVDLFRKTADKISFESFWSHPITWKNLRKLYREFYPEESFASCFWNTKFIAKPVWELLHSFSRMPQAKLYHSVSTGYAGFLAGVAKHAYNRPFLLSEHGIYVRERITGLLQSEWAPTLDSDFVRPPAGVSLFRHTWMDFFIALGRFCYDSADHITSLFERNAQFQLEFGADRNKIEIIPNGINPARFESIESNRNRIRAEMPQRKTVGFLGRIVSIKDVRTLIRAARHTCDTIPDAEFLLVGPTDEDPEYFEGCEKLIKELKLQKNVTITGPKKLDDALPLFDVMVLSSTSEGLPFAILESFAANIPVVSTDVGACSELIYEFDGKGAPGGIIVPVADPGALARALVTVLNDRELQDQYGSNGKSRVDRLYREEEVMHRFQNHYINLGRTTAGILK